MNVVPTPHPVLTEVTQRIEARSQASRYAYLHMVQSAKRPGPYRDALGCANQAHAYAAMPDAEKWTLRQVREPNVGIVTAYNDMLSAHKPYEDYPGLDRKSTRLNSSH